MIIFNQQRQRAPVSASYICLAFVLFLATHSVIVNCGIILTEVDTDADSTDSNSTLEFVHVLFRHGPRTPVSTYPNDPYINESYAPYGWGSLTNGAKVELYKIGKWLRKRYASILGPYYTNDVLQAQSSVSPRTMMSMQLVLAGMFPPENTPLEWNKQLNWQPIPIYTEPEATDYLLRQNADCPRYTEAFEEVLGSEEAQKQLEPYEEMLKELTTLTGSNVTRAHDVWSLYITFLAQKAYGLKLPEWTKTYFPDKMMYLTAQAYVYNVYTTEMRKIKGGFFLEKMLKDMQSVAEGTFQPTGRRANLYCAHDWTIANVLSALNVWKPQLPNFSALIAFELHKSRETGEYFVEIHFQNEPNTVPQKLTVPDCDFQCPLKKLLKIIKPVLPDASYEQLCCAQKFPTTENPIMGKSSSTESIQ